MLSLWRAQPPPPPSGPPWFLEPVFLAGLVGAAVTLTLCLIAFVVLQSSTRGKVLKGTLTKRKMALSSNINTEEEYERDKLRMTLNIEVEAAKKTLTIDAEGDSGDVQQFTGALRDIFAANVDRLTTVRPELIEEADHIHSRFTVIRRSGSASESSALEAELEFTLDEDLD